MLVKVSRLIAFFLAISLILGMNRVPEAHATPMEKVEKQLYSLQQTDLLSCSNLDVIFIVDQSDSMSISGLGSDPLNGRKFAIEGMIDLLVDIAVDQCADSTYRVAVISFGNRKSARVDLPLSNINPNNIEDGRALRDRLVQNLKADQLGQTYPKDGFYEAYLILRDASQYGNEPRKRVILFLTDGIPCSEGDDACNQSRDFASATSDVSSYVSSLFPFDSDLLAAELCLADLRERNENQDLPSEEVNECLKLIPDDKEKVYSQSTYIYTILLKSELSYPAKVLDIFKSMSKNHGGEMVELKRNLSEIPSTMRQILSKLVGIRPNLLTCGNPFAVNPYLSRLRVNVYNISAENKIVLSFVDVNGQTHQIQNGNGDDVFTFAEPYYSFGANERYVFQYPYPGQWQVTAENCTGVEVFADAIDFEVEDYRPNLPDELPEYDIEPYYSIDEQYILEYQMKVGDTVISQAPQSLFAINASVHVTSPDGTEFSYPMQYDSVGHKFVATEPLKLPVDGIYKLILTGNTLRHSGDIVVPANQSDAQVFNEPYQIFGFENQFEVFPVSPFVLQPVFPTIDETVFHVHDTLLGGWKLPVLSLPIRVRVVDRSGELLPEWQEVFINDESSITAVIHSGDKSSRQITLSPDSEKPGEYVGEISDFEVLGEQTLVFSINMSEVNEKYRPDRQTLEVPFTRSDGLLHRPSTYIIAFWLFMVFVFIMIAYSIAIRTNKISGSLTFMDGSTNIAEFGLYSGVNFRKIKKRELDGYPQLMLRSMTARNIGKKRRAAKQDEDAAGAFYSDEQQGIRIDCVSTSGRKFSVDLYPKTPSIYSEETMAQMVYEPME